MMNKKTIQKLWITLFITMIWLFSWINTFVYSQWEISVSNLRDSVMLTTDDNSLINAAINRVAKLQTDIETITDELFKLDEEEKAKHPEMTTSYRQARTEIVRVISSINSANTKLSSSLNRLIQYQRQMRDFLKELKEAQISSIKAKEYLNNYLTLLYKTQLKIYDQDWDKIDDIRLFVNSDNFNETFVGNDLLSAMTVQLSELIEKTTQEEEKKTNLLIKLWSLKIAAQESIETYRNEIDRLEQKKQYLISFITLYREKADAKFDSILTSKEDVNKMVLTFIDDIVKKKYRANDNIPENIKTMLNSPDSSDDDAAPIAWPIYPIEHITHYFNDANFEKTNWFKHQAIQIQATQWTPVYAARDWVVYYVSNSIDWISWILIIHKDGYVTLYEYMNQIIVNPWEIVQRGQIIGYSGWEPGTMWAWFASEWENLTFGVYKELDFWNSVVDWTNIDRDVVICIWVAESTLGKYLTTSNNIWNVGNNDRWDRVAYNTPYAGARLIPLTLNNQHLGKYHTINQLSRYGNPDWKIYASSPINWQTNVMKCLSKIKWYTVPEDFPFRTWPNPNL